MPRLLAMPLAGRGFRAEVARYGASYARLYAAIAAQAGAAYVVDASKWPVQALALSRAGLDVRVIHLVRDVRGVAYSLSKRDVARPHAVGSRRHVALSPAAAAARWVACQSQAELLRRCGLPLARMRYEDFVRQPAAGRGGGAGRARPVRAVGPTWRTSATGGSCWARSHGLSGNPSRFRDGEITLRADEAWRAGCRGATAPSSRRSACRSCCATAAPAGSPAAGTGRHDARRPASRANGRRCR